MPLCALGLGLTLQAPASAQSADAQLPVSVAHIRAGLQQPPSRLLFPASPTGTPTFRIEVRQPLFVVPPLVEEKPFDPTFGLPSVGELFMGGIETIRSSVVQAKRGHAERRARKKVDDELAAFYAANPCSSPSAGPPSPKP
jgi:hypothetical protein